MRKDIEHVLLDISRVCRTMRHCFPRAIVANSHSDLDKTDLVWDYKRAMSAKAVPESAPEGESYL